MSVSLYYSQYQFAFFFIHKDACLEQTTRIMDTCKAGADEIQDGG